MSYKKWIVPSLIVLGALLIAVSIWGPQSQFGLESTEIELGQVLEKTGNVTFLNNEMPSAVQLKKNTSLHSRDSVRTGEISDASIRLNNQAEFKIIEKSEILLDQLDNGQILILIKSGDIYVEKFGGSPSFWVRKDGQLLSANDFILADRRHQNKLKEPLPPLETTDQISQFEIETLLNSKKTDFFKCYGQILQKNAQARGSVLISFTIQKQGQTTKIEISKSDIDDNNFKSCLMEIVARTQFKAFSGQAITTVFPLKFE